MGLDTVELIVGVEKHFDVSISDERAEKILTVEQLARLIYELRSKTIAPLSYEVALIQLQQMITEQFKIPIERIVPNATFVKDLGLDQ